MTDLELPLQYILTAELDQLEAKIMSLGNSKHDLVHIQGTNCKEPDHLQKRINESRRYLRHRGIEC